MSPPMHTIRLMQISILEKVQRRAARWVLSDYSYHSSVSAMLKQLNWLSLTKRRDLNGFVG